ncbi:DUF2798 domain-containing protein [Erysipelotrichaceae bacterium OttesenSCG-928-M19]|nr:DUF2798 domain-containing protein [Erysipelotrichaceae bacterium OttesenSCG-928-M19]
MKRKLFIAACTSICLSILLGCIMILFFVGYTESFFKQALTSTVLGFVIAFPTSLVLPIIFEKIASKLNI